MSMYTSYNVSRNRKNQKLKMLTGTNKTQKNILRNLAAKQDIKLLDNEILIRKTLKQKLQLNSHQ